MKFSPVLAAIVAFPAISVVTLPAQADHLTGVGFGFGFESEDCQWVSKTKYHCFGPHFGNPHYVRPHHQAYSHMACGEARRRLLDRGFRKIKTVDCQGKNYSFVATRKGHHYRVTVNAFTGRMKIHAL